MPNAWRNNMKGLREKVTSIYCWKKREKTSQSFFFWSGKSRALQHRSVLASTSQHWPVPVSAWKNGEMMQVRLLCSRDIVLNKQQRTTKNRTIGVFLCNKPKSVLLFTTRCEMACLEGKNEQRKGEKNGRVEARVKKKCAFFLFFRALRFSRSKVCLAPFIWVLSFSILCSPLFFYFCAQFLRLLLCFSEVTWPLGKKCIFLTFSTVILTSHAWFFAGSAPWNWKIWNFYFLLPPLFFFFPFSHFLFFSPFFFFLHSFTHISKHLRCQERWKYASFHKDRKDREKIFLIAFFFALLCYVGTWRFFFF